ncbi:uncharacterized protein LOC115406088 isoform X2 [Salarias fasciatus]|uniref:uncharacterized protein LOC115406088 isoform X2 n=1 Tax=Salarias fasciatus TaxID=181472 RepID=UPI001176761C|nr:uncharacterized protein LOC115406088 isoform X2 [Salarias fasciatus]
MRLLGFLLLTLCRLQLSAGVPVPVDTVILQIQKLGVVGSPRVVDQVLLNGVSLTGTSPELNGIIKSISADALPQALISINHTSPLRNHTILRSRECILEGSELHWTDRVFYDGKVYLTLDHSGVWTAHVPQALPLKEVWDQEAQGTGSEGKLLPEFCFKLMKELKLSEAQSDSGIPWIQILIPILALLMLSGVLIISLLISKNQGLRHPGGVTGSIIHYPKDMTETDPEKKGFSYQAL